jgi:transposase-like protein
MKERLKNGFLKKSARNKDKMKSKNVIHSYLTHILLDKTGLRPIREFIRTKNSMRLWTSKDSRFHSDFLPIENSLTGKGLRNDEI